MSNEIPDSDEESNCEPGTATPAADLPFAEVANSARNLPNISDRGLDVNFDDFISQTQSSRNVLSQLEQAKHSTEPTKKHFREAPDHHRRSVSSSYDGADDIYQSSHDVGLPPPLSAQRKRVHSEIAKGHTRSGSSQARTKRTKSSRASTRRLVSSQDYEEATEPAGTDQAAFPSAFAARSPSQAPQEQDAAEDSDSRAVERAKKVIDLLGESVSKVGHVLSTSNSSMGGYQSFNLDFRGSGPGLDINTNPFGALSQVSLDAVYEHTAEDGRPDLSSTVPLSATPQQPSRDTLSTLTEAESGLQPTAETSVSDQVQESSSPGNPVYKPTRPRQLSPASIQDASTDQQYQDDYALALPREQDKPRHDKSRGGSIEIEHQSQQLTVELPAKKKGRKKSLEPLPMDTEDSSPAKLPTNELNLSDEAVIGLPKEKYKPRPSRRRSKMIVEEAEASIEVADGSVGSKDPYEQSNQSQQSKTMEAPQTIEVAKAPTPKTRKGKKAKIKRAKTSAACLLRKSEPMISDGEEDVVWMDTKPAAVKLDVPADPLVGKAVRKEEPIDNTITVQMSQTNQMNDDSHTEMINVSTAPETTVIVEIPRLVEKERVEPKKGGRKPKKTTEVSGQEDTMPKTTEAAHISISATNQPASSPLPTASSTILQERDTNTTLPPPTSQKQTALSSPIKLARTTHSPIKPSGGRVLYRVGLSRRSAIPPLLKIVHPPPVKLASERGTFDEDGRPIDLVAETMRKWREMGVLD